MKYNFRQLRDKLPEASELADRGELVEYIRHARDGRKPREYVLLARGRYDTIIDALPPLVKEQLKIAEAHKAIDKKNS